MKRLTGESGLAEAISRLRAGECVALPTETVYGLAADAANDVAVQSIFEAKGRPADHPLIVHLSSQDAIDDWAKAIPASAYTLADAFWPGPLTLLLNRADHVSTVVTGGLDTIGLRSPSQRSFLRILEEVDTGLAAPSANPYKQLSPTTADQVIGSMTGRVNAVFDDGPCEFGLESTIIDLTGSTPTILRAGPISRLQIAAVLKCDVSAPAEHDVAVSGNVRAHYQPSRRLRRLTPRDLIDTDVNAAYLVWSDDAAQRLRESSVHSASTIRLPGDPLDFGRELYAALHQLDQHDVAEIRVELPPDTEDWAAVNDRLRRAEG